MPNQWTEKTDPEERFWSKVDPCRTDGCAVWLGYCDPRGYGKFWRGDVQIGAHEFLNGKAPRGMHWDHVHARGCRNRNCVWPEHLEVVAPGENIRRAREAKGPSTHCKRGHLRAEFGFRNKTSGQWGCYECQHVRYELKTGRKPNPPMDLRNRLYRQQLLSEKESNPPL